MTELNRAKSKRRKYIQIRLINLKWSSRPYGVSSRSFVILKEPWTRLWAMPILPAVQGYSLNEEPQLSHLHVFRSLICLGHKPPCDRPK